MLNVNPDTVCRMIVLAREFHAQEAVTFPEEPGISGGDWAAQMLASHADDATYQEFRSIIDDLEPDQQQEVVALLWLGRGDFTKREWRKMLHQAEEDWPEDTAAYLIAHPLLADHLAEGLDLFGHNCD